LGLVRVAIITRDSPLSPENSIYVRPENERRFVTSLYELIGAKSFSDFRSRFVLTDALRCHCTNPRVPEKALDYCAKFLPEELRLFPNLTTLVVMGEGPYLQFQKHLLGRKGKEISTFNILLGEKGWAREEARIDSLGDRAYKLIYCHHPTVGYKRSPSIADLLD